MSNLEREITIHELALQNGCSHWVLRRWIKEGKLTDFRRVGGLREYARSLGKDESYLRLLRGAARVYETADLSPQFIDKSRHLSEIHKAPQETWSLLCEMLLKREWSVADTKHWIKRPSFFCSCAAINFAPAKSV